MNTSLRYNAEDPANWRRELCYVMKNKVTVHEIILTGLFAALTAIGAFIRIPIPVVPFSLQFFFTTLAGLLLGGRLGAISVGAYIVLGLAGLPIFTQGGGLGYIFVPTFGYIIGFCVAAYITGTLAGKVSAPSYQRLITANFIGLGVVYLFGMAYYYLICNFYLGDPIGVWTLILYCFILAVPGDIVLCLLAAKVAKTLIPVVKKERLSER